MRQTLAFDLDGVMIDTYAPLLSHINLRLGTAYTFDQFDSHDLKLALGLTSEQIVQLLTEFHTDEQLDQLEPIEGAIETLILLSGQYEVVFITGRNRSIQTATQRWVQHRLGFGQVYFGSGRNNEHGGLDLLPKPRIAEELGAICMVDDNDHEMAHWDSVVEPICFAQPWNKSLEQSHPHIPRLNWDGILERYLR